VHVIPAELALINGPNKIVIRPYPASGTDPIMCKTWDLGAPDVRYTTVPNPGADGVTMSAGFLGSRTVVLDLQILGDHYPADKPPPAGKHDPYWYVNALTQMSHPGAQPYLTISRYERNATDEEKWRMYLRAEPFALVYGQRAGAIIELQLTFTCPSGMIESGWKTIDVIDVTGDDTAATDWIFPAIFPKGFGLVGATYPGTVITVEGDAAVTPIIYIFGPVTDPEIHCDEDVFKFDGLTLEAGQGVSIDMGTGDILLSDGAGNPIIDNMTAYGAVDWSVSTYWTWLPGVHHFQFLSTHGSVRIQYRERRFTI